MKEERGTYETGVEEKRNLQQSKRSLSTKNVTGNLDITLLEALVNILNFPDKDIIKHLLHGFPIIGPVAECGYWPKQTKTAEDPIGWLKYAGEGDWGPSLRYEYTCSSGPYLHL